jgi:phosphoribosylglycinamide formyltransferase-1
MKKLAVFVSGGGSNFQALIDKVNEGFINAKIELCISSNPNAYALQRAKENNIASYICEKEPNLETMFSKIDLLLKKYQIDYIILAGYMTVLPCSFVKKYPKKIINVHPSLIPKFCGAGFYGMRVHSAVIAAEETESGCTVHFVDEGIDTGDIIAKASVPVYKTDTAECLQKRVLEKEHELLPKVIKKLCEV